MQVSFLILNFVTIITMPELFREYGFVFLFYSREHEPMHVHVRGNDGEAKFNWDGTTFVLDYSTNIKANDLKRIKQMIDENKDIIEKRWKELFEDV